MSSQSLSRVGPCATPRTIACMAPLSMGFSRQEYWSGFPECLSSKVNAWSMFQKVLGQILLSALKRRMTAETHLPSRTFLSHEPVEQANEWLGKNILASIDKI